MGVGVILDSGGVLLRPVTGRWLPPPAFDEVMHAGGLSWDPTRLDVALEVAGRWLNQVHSIPLADESQERPVWVRYHELVLNELGVSEASALAEVITAAWESKLSVEPFP